MSTNPRLIFSPFIHLTNMIVHYCVLDLVLGPWGWQEIGCSIGSFILIGKEDI